MLFNSFTPQGVVIGNYYSSVNKGIIPVNAYV